MGSMLKSGRRVTQTAQTSRRFEDDWLHSLCPSLQSAASILIRSFSSRKSSFGLSYFDQCHFLGFCRTCLKTQPIVERLEFVEHVSLETSPSRTALRHVLQVLKAVAEIYMDFVWAFCSPSKRGLPGNVILLKAEVLGGC